MRPPSGARTIARGRVGEVHPLPRSDVPLPGCDQPRRYPTSTTPCPTHTGPPIRRTTSRTAGSTTCSKPFTPGLPLDEIQYPTAPSCGPHRAGRTYNHQTARCAVLSFPQLAIPTAALVLPNSPPPSPNRVLAMPTRKRNPRPRPAYRVERELRPKRAPIRRRSTTVLIPGTSQPLGRCRHMRHPAIRNRPSLLRHPAWETHCWSEVRRCHEDLRAQRHPPSNNATPAEASSLDFGELESADPDGEPVRSRRPASTAAAPGVRRLWPGLGPPRATSTTASRGSAGCSSPLEHPLARRQQLVVGIVRGGLNHGRTGERLKHRPRVTMLHRGSHPRRGTSARKRPSHHRG